MGAAYCQFCHGPFWPREDAFKYTSESWAEVHCSAECRDAHHVVQAVEADARRAARNLNFANAYGLGGARTGRFNSSGPNMANFPRAALNISASCKKAIASLQAMGRAMRMQTTMAAAAVGLGPRVDYSAIEHRVVAMLREK